MARKIFKASEVREIRSKVLITPPQIRPKQPELDLEEEIEEIEEAEPVEAEEAAPQPEVEEEPQLAAEEADRLREEAQTEVEHIRKEAEEAAA